MGFSRQEYWGAGCHFLLQGIFPTQGLNPCLLSLLHCRQILYHRASREAHAKRIGADWSWKSENPGTLMTHGSCRPALVLAIWWISLWLFRCPSINNFLRTPPKTRLKWQKQDRTIPPLFSPPKGSQTKLTGRVSEVNKSNISGLLSQRWLASWQYGAVIGISWKAAPHPRTLPREAVIVLTLRGSSPGI